MRRVDSVSSVHFGGILAVACWLWLVRALRFPRRFLWHYHRSRWLCYSACPYLHLWLAVTGFLYLTLQYNLLGLEHRTILNGSLLEWVAGVASCKRTIIYVTAFKSYSDTHALILQRHLESVLIQP